MIHLSDAQIQDYIYGALPDDEDDAAIDHLSKCLGCYDRLITRLSTGPTTLSHMEIGT